MILHFVIDEKVTDQIIENFGKVDENSLFLVFVNFREENYKYISHSPDKLIRFVEIEEDINSLLNKFEPKAIITHAFHLDYAKAIIKIKAKINIAWYTWGFDVYGLPRIKPQTYAVRTNKFLLKRISGLYFGRLILANNFTRKIYFKIKGEEDRYSIIFKALKKVSFFVTYLEEDYKYFSKYYYNKFQFVNSTFSTIDQYLAGNKQLVLTEDAQNILIGNSNSTESNHLDVFSELKDQEILANPKIFAPLSYGGDEVYKNEVIHIGHQIFGPDFVPLIEFMDRNEYISMLSTCSTGIFYHYRQQGMGNIIAMLYLGSRIYLSQKNPAFSFFLNNGIKVFDFDKDFKQFKNSKLENKIARNNKTKLELIFNEDRVFEDIKNLIKVIS